MSRKLTAKEMKRNEFADAIASHGSRVVGLLRDNRKPLISALAAVLVVLLAWAGLSHFAEASRARAQDEFAAALAAFQRAAADATTVPPDWEALEVGFAAVADEHEGDSGSLALHYVGVCKQRSGDHSGAVEVLTSLVDGRQDPRFTPFSLSVLAASQEELGLFSRR